MKPKFLVPAAGDNAGIATRRIEAGETITVGDTDYTVSHVVPKGHRLCIEQMEPGQSVLSWGLPFGHATKTIRPGDYLCNSKMEQVLKLRNLEDYPDGLVVNFADRDTTKTRSLPKQQIIAPNDVMARPDATFEGYWRGPARGWGTRNYVALIGVTSRSRSLVLSATERLKRLDLPHVDGIVPIVHTEAGGDNEFHNRDLLIRTLSGFALNPNLGAAIFVNGPDSPLSNADILAYLSRSGGIGESIIRYFLDTYEFNDGVDRLVNIADKLAHRITKFERATAPLSGLRLGLQCGGSDAFSGVTANQVLGHAVQTIISQGGTANLAETDELIGAEEYVLSKVANPEIAEQFIEKQDNFKAYARIHEQTAEGNVSGGNIYRGLYNITLKSIGAGRKKHPQTSIDQVIGYGEHMSDPGYYFMDSPGNDLESIAGQVASGANIILFTTGNGSITNFPFVPTIKIVTTTERYMQLETDMDFDAGRLLDGEPMAAAGERLYDLTCATASGHVTKGEKTGQHQVQIWRDWYQDIEGCPTSWGASRDTPEPDGLPLVPTTTVESVAAGTHNISSENLLIIPTSLCSGQVAEQIAEKINVESDEAKGHVVALPHTEGCGVSGGNAEEIYTQTMMGYAKHPSVRFGVFLEHGCEKTHNDYFQNLLKSHNIDPSRYGWASIQGAGGITAVTDTVQDILSRPPETTRTSEPVAKTLRTVGIYTGDNLSVEAVQAATSLVKTLLSNDISVVLSLTDPLLASTHFCDELGIETVRPTTTYGGGLLEPGLHVMEVSKADWLEIATGIGATGALAFATFPNYRPLQPHRMVPTLQFGTAESPRAADFDLHLTQISGSTEFKLSAMSLLERVISGDYVQKIEAVPNVGFQISRGKWGVSL
jgi:altronate dehydratase